MNLSDFDQIEKTISSPLPSSYRETMSKYPFGDDIWANECLPNDCKAVLELNASSRSLPVEIKRPFFIGHDGGEETYFVDLENPGSTVYCFDLETGKSEVKAKSWKEFLVQIEADLKAIEEDEREEQLRKANKRWWEFWK